MSHRQRAVSSVIKIDPLMQHTQTIAACFENHKKHTNTLCGENLEIFTFCATGS